uniref:Uncharacterized protein LOC104232251 n=1 Tax=Nicotiana sylvestris TaxID=4096 RepID=A0A1U7WYL6_NICSY|nr:PREDICTED: uncharacterized protein LOC104232251 [Nicotiana sylvestris]
MVDDRSGECIIHPRVFAQIKLEDSIVPRCITLTGFNNAVEQTSGEIALFVLAGGITLETTIHIMDQDTTYNAIIGQSREGITINWVRVGWRRRERCHQGPQNHRGHRVTVEDLDLVQLDKDDHSKKTYIGHKLQEPGRYVGHPERDSDTQVERRPILPPVRKVRQKFNSAINDAVREEVEKMLENGSIRELKYPQWVANVVVVKKKNGKWRMCVDFTDLNKAHPKD